MLPDLLIFFFMISTPPNREIFTVCFDPPSQSIGCGRISREAALDVRERREWRDKIFAEETENAKILDQKQQFLWGFFYCFGRGKTYFRGGGAITTKLASQ